jgi:hypothetical protein
MVTDKGISAEPYVAFALKNLHIVLPFALILPPVCSLH